ncbi:Serine/threonine-protein kinase [Epichloe bromicola]|uniref:non-specific serine/threonine protein kinase n=1 Tax=Epichloe bromicola TaxID=79588 RepID=A0ABQ0CMZ2_9HYPO
MSAEDKYDTLEKIGHGSFGVIRKVRRKADGFIMCRKEISYLRMSQKEREQLHAEFQILSHLRHPNIVAYYHREHLKASQDLHLYMEYCGNGDLGRVIKDLHHKGQRAQESFVWSIFSQLVMALYRCHYGVDPPEAGANALGLTQGNANGTPQVPAGTMTILHRDLKPENVFLGEDNSVKLGDFGLSKMIKSHDFASTYVGTPFYMSPEICAAEKYTLKSDIWSLGCIIYELCAREPPFNAKTHFQLVQKIKEGKVATLPEMYSPELNQVIRDCLKVNPDRRPDTVQLLNLPIVKFLRKEKEVVDMNKSLRSREELLLKREKELSERLVGLDREREMMREEIDSSLRREWEVKARLEIDRLANAEIERLQKQFEEEIKVRVEAELEKHTTLGRGFSKPNAISPENPTAPVDKSGHRRTASGAGGEEFPSVTDLAEFPLESPGMSKEAKRTARTPFGRAQTMFAGQAGTPMDIEMVSPSPMAIASLSLSPRRNGASKAPTTHNGNIFAANNANKVPADPRWDLRDPPSIDSDDEDFVPSPTRNVRSAKNPFASKNRPVLTSQKSCPSNRLKPQASSTGLVSKAAVSAQAEPRPRSPTRQISKIPSMTSLQADPNTGGLTRKHSVKKENGSGDGLGKMAAKNNIKGRTLVELQQARAGGRPLSAGAGGASENASPKRVAFKDRVAGERRASGGSSSSSSSSGSRSTGSSGSEAVAIWDPERDEMPSPFLVRQKRVIKV